MKGNKLRNLLNMIFHAMLKTWSSGLSHNKNRGLHVRPSIFVHPRDMF